MGLAVDNRRSGSILPLDVVCIFRSDSLHVVKNICILFDGIYRVYDKSMS